MKDHLFDEDDPTALILKARKVEKKMSKYTFRRKEELIFEVEAKDVIEAQKIADESSEADYTMQVESITNQMIAVDGKYFRKK